MESMKTTFKRHLAFASIICLFSGCAAGEMGRFSSWLGKSEPSNLESSSFASDVSDAGASAVDGEQESAQLASASAPYQQRSLVTLKPGENLDDLLSAAPGTVLLDFYADWCGPCRQQGKILHDLEITAARHSASIVKVDVDKHPKLKKQYNVSALPTLVVIRNGQVVSRQRGLADRQKIAAWLSNEG